MFIESLTLQNFRCFKEGSFTFQGTKTVISGENGRGKSNLLESIYFLAVAKSSRGALERDVLRHGADYFNIRSSVIKKGSLRASIRIYYDPHSGKRIYLDECLLPRLSDLIGTFNAVLFSPEDVDLVLRYPHERRRMLDILASQASISYLSDLQIYQRALAQRNRLLRNGISQAVAEAQLQPWDVQLADAGARIVRYRTEAVEQMGSSARQFHASFSPEGEDLCVRYQSPWAADTVEESQVLILSGLQRQRDRELDLGYTLSGPHKDQLLFEIGGRDVQRHASQGQMKSALLSWKLAEAVFLESVAHEAPVLLLDDIFSELDARRSLRLLSLLSDFGQVILTTSRDPDLPISEYQGISI